MNEPKFTPGPWRLDADSHIRATNDDRHKTIALIPPDFHSADIWDANAHLIAAAPDLYKALAHLEPYLDAIVCYASTIEEHPPNGFILETKAALAKARGER